MTGLHGYWWPHVGFLIIDIGFLKDRGVVEVSDLGITLIVKWIQLGECGICGVSLILSMLFMKTRIT